MFVWVSRSCKEHPESGKQGSGMTYRTLILDRATTGGFPSNSHTMRITAEQVNILTYPLESEALVQQASIGSCYIGR